MRDGGDRKRQLSRLSIPFRILLVAQPPAWGVCAFFQFLLGFYLLFAYSLFSPLLSFQFLLGFYLIVACVPVTAKRYFQFLLGFYLLYRCLTSWILVVLSIPFRILRAAWRPAWRLRPAYFQFLLGFYAGSVRSCLGGSNVLSIPFRILRLSTAEAGRALKRAFQFLLGFYLRETFSNYPISPPTFNSFQDSTWGLINLS